MKNKHLRRLIAFGTTVLAGLFVVQAYWFKKAFDVEEKEFDHSVQVALIRVADSLSSTAEIRKLSSNFFFVQTESQLNGKKLDTLLRNEFQKRSLRLDYELGVYDADDDTLVYGQYVEATKKQRMEQGMVSREGAAREKNFAVYFPRKKSYVASGLDVWIFSSVVLFLMTCFFAYAIVTLLRERRFAELKNDFINNMTHEFKTPVTNIGIAGEILRKKIPEAANVQAYLDIVLKENQRLRAKIDQVLLGATVEYGLRPAAERVDVHALIRECAEAFDLKVRERNGSIGLSFNAKTAFVQGDRELLAQAINNVIDNAEKYSPGSPCIRVVTRDEADGIRIDVIDQGMGIPAPAKERVFEKFFRVRQGDTETVKGFGLGLNFVKSVIRSHRGTVRLVSELHKGTEVTIFLPKL